MNFFKIFQRISQNNRAKIVKAVKKIIDDTKLKNEVKLGEIIGEIKKLEDKLTEEFWKAIEDTKLNNEDKLKKIKISLQTKVSEALLKAIKNTKINNEAELVNILEDKTDKEFLEGINDIKSINEVELKKIGICISTELWNDIYTNLTDEAKKKLEDKINKEFWKAIDDIKDGSSKIKILEDEISRNSILCDATLYALKQKNYELIKSILTKTKILNFPVIFKVDQIFTHLLKHEHEHESELIKEIINSLIKVDKEIVGKGLINLFWEKDISEESIIKIFNEYIPTVVDAQQKKLLLIQAIVSNKLEVAWYLADREVKLQLCDNIALCFSNLNAPPELLLDIIEDINEVGYVRGKQTSVLREAIKSCNLEMVKWLVKKGADVNYPDLCQDAAEAGPEFFEALVSSDRLNRDEKGIKEYYMHLYLDNPIKTIKYVNLLEFFDFIKWRASFSTKFKFSVEFNRRTKMLEFSDEFKQKFGDKCNKVLEEFNKLLQVVPSFQILFFALHNFLNTITKALYSEKDARGSCALKKLQIGYIKEIIKEKVIPEVGEYFSEKLFSEIVKDAEKNICELKKYYSNRLAKIDGYFNKATASQSKLTPELEKLVGKIDSKAKDDHIREVYKYFLHIFSVMTGEVPYNPSRKHDLTQELQEVIDNDLFPELPNTQAEQAYVEMGGDISAARAA